MASVSPPPLLACGAAGGEGPALGVLRRTLPAPARRGKATRGRILSRTLRATRHPEYAFAAQQLRAPSSSERRVANGRTARGDSLFAAGPTCCFRASLLATATADRSKPLLAPHLHERPVVKHGERHPDGDRCRL